MGLLRETGEMPPASQIFKEVTNEVDAKTLNPRAINMSEGARDSPSDRVQQNGQPGQIQAGRSRKSVLHLY